MDFDDQPQALTRDRLDGMDAEEDGPCGWDGRILEQLPR
jgi:hypothetical protein